MKHCWICVHYASSVALAFPGTPEETSTLTREVPIPPDAPKVDGFLGQTE